MESYHESVSKIETLESRTAYCSSGRTIVAMRVLVSRRASQVHSSRQRRQNDLGHSVAAANRILQDLQVSTVLDRLRHFRTTPLDLISRHLQHLISVLGSCAKSTGAAADRLVAKMGRDQSELVLLFDRSLKEALHELESLLLVAESPASIDALEIEVEVAILEAGFEHVIDLGWVLGEQQAVVDSPHGPDWDLLALPFDGLRNLGGGSHVGEWR